MTRQEEQTITPNQDFKKPTSRKNDEHKRQTSSRDYKTDQPFDFIDYKLKLIIKIAEKIQGSYESAYKTVFIQILRSFIDQIDIWDSKSSMDEVYNFAIDTINEIFIRIKAEYFKKYGLKDDILLEEIDYEANYKDFISQLEKIKLKYSKRYQLKRRIDEETEIYKSYAIYNDRTETYIERIKINYFFYAIEKDYFGLDQIILAMHKKLEETFLDLIEIDSHLKRLESEVNSSSDADLVVLFEELLDSYQRKKSLSEIKRKITYLNEKITEKKLKHKRINTP